MVVVKMPNAVPAGRTTRSHGRRAGGSVAHRGGFRVSTGELMYWSTAVKSSVIMQYASVWRTTVYSTLDGTLLTFGSVTIWFASFVSTMVAPAAIGGDVSGVMPVSRWYSAGSEDAPCERHCLDFSPAVSRGSLTPAYCFTHGICSSVSALSAAILVFPSRSCMPNT